MSGRNSSSAVVRSAPLELSRAFNVQQGLQAIVGNCLRQIQGNEAGVIHGTNPESVHQMRVGVRRMRTALKLFERYIPPPLRLQSELAWLNQRLGSARNWDVLSGSTLACGANHPMQEVLLFEQLRQSAVQTAATQRKRVAASVGSARYARLRSAIAVWLDQLAEHESEAVLSEPLGPCAARLLERNQAKILKRGKRQHDGDVQRRHRLRIAAKRVRYTAEFFSSLYSVRRMTAFIAGLSALQEVLGRLNDIAVADGLLGSLVKKRAALTDCADHVRACLARDSKRDLRKLDKLWLRFVQMKSPKLSNE